MGGFGEIKIFSQVGAVSEILRHRNYWYVVSVRGTRSTSPVDQFADLMLGFFPVSMDDIWDDSQEVSGEFEMPLESEVARVLAWAAERRPLLVHCRAGVSRSSALAYLVACTQVSPEEAIRLLEYQVHYPNQYIVALGSKILNNPDIAGVANREFWSRGRAG